MIVVIGAFQLPLASLAAAREAMARVIAASRAEPGCLSYAYAEDILAPGLFRVSEAWESRAALAEHFKAAHMNQWQRERADLGMSDRAVTAYEVGDAERL